MTNPVLSASALTLLLLGACAGPPPHKPGARAGDDELNQSGRPYSGPPGIVAAFPPADNNAQPLLCHPEGPGTVCTRSP